MQAVIKTSGRQFIVKQGDQITINSLPGNVGDKVTFDQVLMLGDKVGAPFISGAKVTGVVKEQGHGDKVVIFKYRRRKNYKRTRGHKQPQTVVEISALS